jgi:hypothetical protein
MRVYSMDLLKGIRTGLRHEGTVREVVAHSGENLRVLGASLDYGLPITGGCYSKHHEATGGWRTVVFLTQWAQAEKPVERGGVAGEVMFYLTKRGSMGILEPMGVIGSRRDNGRIKEELSEGVAEIDEFWSESGVFEGEVQRQQDQPREGPHH